MSPAIRTVREGDVSNAELLIAVVRKSNADSVISALVAEGYRVTAMNSFGGFLREENQTLFLAVDQEKRQAVLDIFARFTGEEVEVPLVLMERLKDWREATVHHAGATILILPLEDVVRT